MTRAMNVAIAFASAADRESAHRFFADRPFAQSQFEALAAHVARLGDDITLTSTGSRVALRASIR